ncbi:hypothetical protein EVAR_65886_1 [Eumeta japonica]|uniref:Uncharacterized protein n=1 Tax=Eumeta variegata TaxID=151549 RepID=A0A4C2A5Y6_EUMVA|nr:hypothetical protein EVAR_65886_1 [Eumeta japonica]
MDRHGTQSHMTGFALRTSLEAKKLMNSPSYVPRIFPATRTSASGNANLAMSSVHRTAVSRIFYSYLGGLTSAASNLIFWPSKSVVQKTMPDCFHPNYTNTRGLMMEPEGKHRNSIMKQRILAVFGLVEIVLRCTLTMNDFQGLMMQLEGSDNGAGSLEAPSSDPESQSWSKYISGQFQQAQIWLGYIVPL